MKNYKETLIQSKEELLKVIEKIHFDCYRLCKQALGKYIENAGNIGVFCQSEEEYEILTLIREELTKISDNTKQKYYVLKEPIIIQAYNEVPQVTYTHLYIRKPDPTPYGLYRGDIDFFLEESEYNIIKKLLLEGKVIKGTQIYDRPGWDMIQLSDPEINSVAYVSTKKMTQAVHVKID